QPLWADLVRKRGHAGKIATRPVQAVHKSKSNGIGAREKNDRYSIGRGFGSSRSGNAARRDNHRHPAADKFGAQRLQSSIVGICPGVFYGEISGFGKAEVL